VDNARLGGNPPKATSPANALKHGAFSEVLLELAGVEFIDGNGGAVPGYDLRNRIRPQNVSDPESGCA
jgi:hypothetical protein